MNDIVLGDNFLDDYFSFSSGISSYQYDAIILKFLNLLRNRAYSYTGCCTSSLSIDVLRSINESNMWMISVYLSKRDKNDVINSLLLDDIGDIYNAAKNFIDDIVSRVKFFYRVVFINNMLDIDNYFYNSTLRDGIDCFFKKYNSSYHSKDIFITVDYDPFLERPPKDGILFIKKYLEYINYENKFCRCFDQCNINNLLSDLYCDYSKLPINIFFDVFIVSIVLSYLKRDIFSLDLNFIDISILYDSYFFDNEKYFNDLGEAYRFLKDKLVLDYDTINYLDECSLLANTIIVNYTKNNNLDVLLCKKDKKEIKYISNPRMDNDKFNEILNNIRNDSISIDSIFNYSISFYDIIDLIDIVDFKSDQLFLLFSNFSILEMMALKKWYSDMDNADICNLLDSFIELKGFYFSDLINRNYKYVVIYDVL